MYLYKRICLSVGPSDHCNIGQMRPKTTHWGKGHSHTRSTRSAALRSAALHSAALCFTPLCSTALRSAQGSFVSEKVAMYKRDHMRQFDTDSTHSAMVCWSVALVLNAFVKILSNGVINSHKSVRWSAVPIAPLS